MDGIFHKYRFFLNRVPTLYFISKTSKKSTIDEILYRFIHESFLVSEKFQLRHPPSTAAVVVIRHLSYIFHTFLNC